MATELTWGEAISKVLAEAGEPLHGDEITQRIIADGLRSSLGATPAATVGAHIYSSIKRLGSKSPYIRVGKSTFALANPNAAGQPVLPDSTRPLVEEEGEDQYSIVTSFGMFWRRGAVEWTGSPRILGMQQIGATPVDFNAQLGIYLLYDGREVIYIGRSTDRPLGRRLYEHTRDRLAVRWDRFSWFGLLPVSDKGVLGSMPPTYHAAAIIPTFEAILIEALEPRQNRRRGDDLAAVEYIQCEDPEVERKRLTESIIRVVNSPASH